MSNNKQIMKLYTERQMKEMFRMGLANSINEDGALGQFAPIELPSDEEMDRESEVLYPINKGGSMWMPSRYDINKANRQEGFLEGAKWMKEQILNQNK